jgi:tRNA-2-methylthio-N6-dimethylallyladenosine synthase
VDAGSGDLARVAGPVDGAPAGTLVRPGDVVEVVITRGAPHHLIADGPPRSHRRTRAGDLWEAARAAPPARTGPAAVDLGMPAGLSAGPTASRA